MTITKAEELLNKLNTTFGGRIFPTDNTGQVRLKDVQFYLDNALINFPDEAADKIYSRITSQHDTWPRGTNIIKFLKENNPRYYDQTAADRSWSWITDRPNQAKFLLSYLGNRAVLADSEVCKQTGKYSFTNVELVRNPDFSYEERIEALIELLDEYESSGKEWYKIRHESGILSAINAKAAERQART